MSADVDVNLQDMDIIENPSEAELVTLVLRNEVQMRGLNFTDEEMKDFLERVNRRLRVLHKAETLAEESRTRVRVLLRRDYEEKMATLASEGKSASIDSFQ